MKIFVIDDSNTIKNIIFIKLNCEPIIISYHTNCIAVKEVDDNVNQIKCAEHKMTEKANVSTNKRELHIRCCYFEKLLKELSVSSTYRKYFLLNFKNMLHVKDISVIVRLSFDLRGIDYSWEYRCNFLLQEKEHLNSAMSWLSTLGGAFSALGDFDPCFAERAGLTSYKQMLIACRLGDLNLVARCWLYCTLALIQKRKYKKAAAIIKYVFNWAKQNPEGKVDHRISNMCYGIWCKLKYEQGLFVSSFGRTIPNSRQL